MAKIHNEVIRLVNQASAAQETIDALIATILWTTSPDENDRLPKQYICNSRNIEDFSLKIDSWGTFEIVEHLFHGHKDPDQILHELQPILESGFSAQRCIECDQFIRPKSRTFLSASRQTYHFGCFLSAANREVLAAQALPMQLEDLVSVEHLVLKDSPHLLVIRSDIGLDQPLPAVLFLVKSTLSKFQVSDQSEYEEFRAKLIANRDGYRFQDELKAVRAAFDGMSEERLAALE